jgi:hypothetical protein
VQGAQIATRGEAPWEGSGDCQNGSKCVQFEGTTSPFRPLGFPGVPMATGGEGQAAAALRQAVVAELIKRRADIEPFIPGILDGDLTFEDYCERMSHPSAWGGAWTEDGHKERRGQPTPITHPFFTERRGARDGDGCQPGPDADLRLEDDSVGG